MAVDHESVFDTDFFSRSVLTRSAYHDVIQRGLAAILAPVTEPVYPQLVRLFFQNLRPSPRTTAELITTIDGHQITITVDSLARSCHCPHRCPPELQELYLRLYRPSYTDMAVFLTGHYADGETFATRTFLPDDLWFFDSVLFRNIYMAGHKIQRRGDYLTALYAFYTGHCVSIPALIWSVMRKLFDEYISKEKPGRAKSLPFGHLITQILINQRYPIHPREHPERGSCHFLNKDWDKSYNAIITRLQHHAVVAAEELETEEAEAAAEAAAADPAADDVPVDPAAEHIDIDLERPADDTEQHSPAGSPIHEQEQTQDFHSSDSSIPEALDQTPGFRVRLQTLEYAVVAIRADLTAHRADFATFRTDVATMFRDLSKDIRGARPARPASSS
ncbi:uncharacterized protein LOC132279513 [Cornus florida]|uniref:uncharacterized protein LOC132279513 n=1 Tax=Cornus florida TaxID=4283 RepID=UPI002898E5FF|nr:uncharacterized protein LOC132279513 [Cornus florida]